MIDPRIIQALSNSDPDKRKKAVAYLAKSLDRDALPHLARVYKTDGDPEIRELAKKAGAYIQKNAPQTTTAYDDDDDAPYGSVYADDEPEAEPSYSRYGSLYADEDDDDDIASGAGDDVPLPSNIQISPIAEERAKAFVEQAMDWDVRGKNDKAIEMLRKAFKTNPRLLYDSYTLSLAANITGLSSEDIRRMFAPTAKDLEKSGALLKESRPATSRKLNAIQQLFALVVFIGATSVLVGFFALPWVDFGWIPFPIDELNAQLGGLGNLRDLEAVGVNADNFGTIGGAVGEFQKLLNSPQIREAEAQANLFFGTQAGLIRDFIGGLRSIRTGASGMDTMLYMTGSQDALRAFFGLGGLIDVLLDALDDPMFANLVLSTAQSQFGDLGAFGVDANSLTPDAIRAGINIGLAQLKYTPQTTDFSVIAVPVAGSLAFLFALLLYMTPSMTWWILNILVGLVGVGACAYFYTTGIDNLITGGADITTTLNDFGVTVTSPNQFIGIGFWISMGGMIAVAIAPFLGMLFAPAKQNA